MSSKFSKLRRESKTPKVNPPIQEPQALFADHEVAELMESLNEPIPEPMSLEDAIVLAASSKTIEPVVAPNVAADEEIFEAFGLVLNTTLKKYMKVTIDYNPKTGYAKIREVIPFADNGTTALHKLNKVLSLRLLKKEEQYKE
jgi:hypothetical protein